MWDDGFDLNAREPYIVMAFAAFFGMVGAIALATIGASMRRRPGATAAADGTGYDPVVRRSGFGATKTSVGPHRLLHVLTVVFLADALMLGGALAYVYPTLADDLRALRQ